MLVFSLLKVIVALGQILVALQRHRKSFRKSEVRNVMRSNLIYHFFSWTVHATIQ